MPQSFTLAQRTALEVLWRFTRPTTVAELHANGVRLDVIRRLCTRKLAFCARDWGNDPGTTFALTDAGREAAAQVIP